MSARDGVSDSERPRAPALRSDLVIREVEENGAKLYVIKDPLAQRFFRVKPLEHYLLIRLDGKTSLEEIRRQASLERKVIIAPEVLERFVEKFETLGLVSGATREPEPRREPPRSHLFSLRFPLANPEALLDRLYPRLRWVFQPAIVVLMLVAMVLAGGLALIHREELLFGFDSIARIEGLLLIAVTLFALTVLHELAHGLTCRHFAGRVQDMGFLLLYFLPCFYCNVSDTYLFKEKRQRLWVLFSGAYFELFLWSTAVLGWRVVAPETFVSRVFLIVIAVAGVRSLFNFNPLLKLDGYYMLSDHLGIPNLRRESMALLGRGVRIALGLHPPPPRADLVGRSILALRGDRFLVVFGALALVYTGLVVSYVLVWSGEWVFEQFGSSGLGFFAAVLVGLLHKPAAAAASGASEVSKEKWEQLKEQKRRPRFVLLWGAAFLVVALFPWQLRIPSELKILPSDRATVRASAEGRIARIYFSEGERVQKGDLLLEYDTRELELEIQTKQAELERAREELRLMEKRNPTWQEEIRIEERALETARTKEDAARQELGRVQQLWTLGLVARERLERARSDLEAAESERRRQEARTDMVSKSSRDSRLEEIERIHLRDPEAQRAVIARLEAELARLDDLLRRSRIRAPISGTLTTYRFQEKVGEYLEEGAFVCEIMDDDRVVVEMQVREKEIDAVEVGYPVKFKVRGYPHESFMATVAEIAPVATRGEEVSTILVRATVPNSDRLLKPGMTGIAKIYCGRTVVAHVLTRDIIRFIRTEFWL